ncbi:hypothetical protein [Endozoicomonas ascidiicola]|uniref:hypothetical protein n=1 Tax=Endozoicomonas ascidiicola TaxID=1698521 RepID=UPI000BA42F7F|nr:hypothetical protein [Endozoicomonas ascidiicola]
MYSQSLRAQLGRMTLLLGVTLMIVHSTPGLIELLAGQAVDAGCHQSVDMSPAEGHSGHQTLQFVHHYGH